MSNNAAYNNETRVLRLLVNDAVANSTDLDRWRLSSAANRCRLEGWSRDAAHLGGIVITESGRAELSHRESVGVAITRCRVRRGVGVMVLDKSVLRFVAEAIADSAWQRGIDTKDASPAMAQAALDSYREVLAQMTSDGLEERIKAALAKPGDFVPGYQYGPIHAWQARAVLIALGLEVPA